MPPIRITAKVESDTLTLPGLGALVGKTVEIRIAAEPASAVERLTDDEYHAECEADTSPQVSLTEVRAALASIPGTMTADFIAGRDER